MTTVVISCEHKQVAVDARRTLSYTNNDTVVDKEVCQYEQVSKLHDLGNYVIVGAGQSLAISEFIAQYSETDIPTKTNYTDARVAVVGFKCGNLEVDLYKIMEKGFWPFKKNIWVHQNYSMMIAL